MRNRDTGIVHLVDPEQRMSEGTPGEPGMLFLDYLLGQQSDRGGAKFELVEGRTE